MADVTVTIKSGASYDDTWQVFKGTVEDVREQALDYFGIDPDSVLYLSTHDIIVNLTNMAHGVSNAATGLGGTVVEPTKTSKSEQTGDNPWAGLGEDEAKSEPVVEQDPEEQRLLALVAAAESVATLQREVWVKNRAGYDKYPSVVAAYKARGKELSK